MIAPLIDRSANRDDGGHQRPEGDAVVSASAEREGTARRRRIRVANADEVSVADPWDEGRWKRLVPSEPWRAGNALPEARRRLERVRKEDPRR